MSTFYLRRKHRSKKEQKVTNKQNTFLSDLNSGAVVIGPNSCRHRSIFTIKFSTCLNKQIIPAVQSNVTQRNQFKLKYFSTSNSNKREQCNSWRVTYFGKQGLLICRTLEKQLLTYMLALSFKGNTVQISSPDLNDFQNLTDFLLQRYTCDKIITKILSVF